jgi:YidC/Oxa1 family membrane protein insertase
LCTSWDDTALRMFSKKFKESNDPRTATLRQRSLQARGRHALRANREPSHRHKPHMAPTLVIIAQTAGLFVNGTAWADDAVPTAIARDNGWLNPIVNSLDFVLGNIEGLYQSVGIPYAYGWSIISLTAFVKLVTLPLTKKQVESAMAVQQLKPRIDVIKERYGDDKDKIQKETSRLYEQAQVNPLAGCLPSLLQLPIFLGLYRSLSNVATSGTLDNEGFFWIPSLAGRIFPPVLLTAFWSSEHTISWHMVEDHRELRPSRVHIITKYRQKLHNFLHGPCGNQIIKAALHHVQDPCPLQHDLKVMGQHGWAPLGSLPLQMGPPRLVGRQQHHTWSCLFC